MSETVAIVTLGCKTNQFESQLMEEHLRGAGYQVVSFETGADLVIVNTCAVTSVSEAQSRNLVRRCRRLNPACRVVVTGCCAQLHPQDVQRLPGVDLVLGNEEKNNITGYLPQNGIHVTKADQRLPLEFSGVPVTGRSRAYVQIQTGCDAFCSYCIVPYARGRSRSLAPERVLDLVARLEETGFTEVVLTGIHIGCYGRDLPEKTDLAALVRRILAQTGIRRVRLGSIEPHELGEDLLELAFASPRVCPHFHIPLQSGDDAVLERMRRPYTGAFFRALVERIHRALPQAALGVDVMTGFPGETPEAFEHTFHLLEELPVSHLHVFPYSRRAGTPAATFPDQVPAEISKERAARLRSLGQETRGAFMERCVGRTLQVVVERRGGADTLCRGLSENYVPVLFSAEHARERELLPVIINGWNDDALEGVLKEGRIMEEREERA
ncbi:MAG: tRNA (N(6)-L-threonylcarbamoyladenosine(37)-C(2))-methylthiotransferase MtaB [Deltaproteobacteria bacterium]|nr:tRNA (N(6)-L-threonylcarbamoyladenosine(37)-C(2))-methylthiotransferase MtaB [Deltaproteobacteria bacterium]